jgi:endo-alpha-1,4-polygalactosaminidase (GH114 family)
MSEYIAQKEVPDLIIDGILLDTIDEFDLFSKNGNTEITV